MGRTVQSRDSCVVPTEQLSGLVNGFVDEFTKRILEKKVEVEAAVTKDDGRDGGRLEGVRFLAEQTGVPAKTVENVIYARNRNTELRIADRLLTAIGRPDALCHMDVQENPLADKVTRARCCSGSLTASGYVTPRAERSS